MRIITWNCQFNEFHKKGKDSEILEQRPDVLVVQEYERTPTIPEGFQPSGQDWIGDESHPIGLAVFCFNGWHLERPDGYDPNIKYFAPFRVTKGDTSLTLLAAWTWKPKESSEEYHDVVSRAVDHYDQILGQEKMLFLGDFNTPGAENNLAAPKPGNRFLEKHLEIVEKLSQKGVKSVFHEKHNLEHGKEPKENATLFFRNRQDEPFHCDYCFASADMLKRLQDVKLGTFDDWIKYSDHMPLIVDFEL